MLRFTAHLRIVLVLFPLILASCASLSSVHRAQSAAAAANVRAQRAEAQARTLAKKVAAMQADFSSNLAEISTQQMTLASAAAAAQTQSLTALRRVKRAEQMLSATLASDAKNPAGEPRSAQGDRLYSRLVAEARLRAERAYVSPHSVPAVLTRMDREAFDKLAWRGTVPGWPIDSHFSLAFQPAGYLYDHGITVHLVNGTGAETLTFTPRDFSIPASLAHRLPARVAAAGINFSYPLNAEHQADEFLSFLGASYFRALGRRQWWGLSARGLAVNTAVPNMQEEFPFFRSFWVVVPPADARSMTVLALLDSPSVTGAYRFVITPGETTTLHITAILFLRHSVRRLGLAPLTSMFLQGRASPRRVTALHQEIHDSDGLSIETQTGQWLWRPLTNPARLSTTSFELDNPAGYGLMQRDRDFNEYQSLSNHYQDRPSAWVRFLGHWGRGHIELIEIPSRSAANDNVVAFWVPRKLPQPGQPLTLRYDIQWQGGEQTHPPLAWTVETRQVRLAGDIRMFTLYFSGGELAQLPSWVLLQPEVRVSGAQPATNVTLVKLPTGGRWRLRFTVHGNAHVKINAQIVYRGKSLTENWNYEPRP